MHVFTPIIQTITAISKQRYCVIVTTPQQLWDFYCKTLNTTSLSSNLIYEKDALFYVYITVKMCL